MEESHLLQSTAHPHAKQMNGENNKTTRRLWRHVKSRGTFKAVWQPPVGRRKSKEGFLTVELCLEYGRSQVEAQQEQECVNEQDPVTGFVHYGSTVEKNGSHLPWLKGFDGMEIPGQLFPTFPTSQEACAFVKEIYEKFLVERARLETCGVYVSQMSPVSNVIFPSW